MPTSGPVPGTRARRPDPRHAAVARAQPGTQLDPTGPPRSAGQLWLIAQSPAPLMIPEHTAPTRHQPHTNNSPATLTGPCSHPC
jgi:hypothetical protein